MLGMLATVFSRICWRISLEGGGFGNEARPWYRSAGRLLYALDREACWDELGRSLGIAMIFRLGVEALAMLMKGMSRFACLVLKADQE